MYTIRSVKTYLILTWGGSQFWNNIRNLNKVREKIKKKTRKLTCFFHTWKYFCASSHLGMTSQTPVKLTLHGFSVYDVIRVSNREQVYIWLAHIKIFAHCHCGHDRTRFFSCYKELWKKHLAFVERRDQSSNPQTESKSIYGKLILRSLQIVTVVMTAHGFSSTTKNYEERI